MSLSNKVVRVAALADGWLHVELSDGRSGEFDVKPFIGIRLFRCLEKRCLLQAGGFVFDGVGWPDGQDLGPDTIAAFLRVTEGVRA